MQMVPTGSCVRGSALSVLLLVGSVGLASGQMTAEKPAAPAQTTSSHQAESVGLKVGDTAPDAELMGVDGKPVMLESLLKNGPVVIVFYRGGWCPFCNKHLHEWTLQMDELKKSGAILVAISPEKPDESAKTIKKGELRFTVLSDMKMQAAKGFGLAFDMDEKTVTKYKGYGLDLAKSNGSGQWQLPHPGTFVVDQSGTIRYASAGTDYTKRADPKDAMDVVRQLAKK